MKRRAITNLTRASFVHFDTKRLPFLKGQSANEPRVSIYLCLSMISPGSCMPIFFPIKPSIVQLAFSQALLFNVLTQIDYAYSDNGKEFKGTDTHAFIKACRQHGIGQKLTRVNRPQTNGKS
ncbi:MAG: hypothetical protein IPI17_17435 [Nitrosomonas sp.]|nr:hypothetical protein [Nitrosomonas sp.]